MKPPSAPLYPVLHNENTATYRLQRMAELEGRLLDEKDKRERLYKRYHRAVNIAGGCDASVTSTILILAAVGFAIPGLIPIEICTGLFGSLIFKLLKHKLALKAEKHCELKAIVSSKLNSIGDLITDSSKTQYVSDERFNFVIQEFERYCEMKKKYV